MGRKWCRSISKQNLLCSAKGMIVQLIVLYWSPVGQCMKIKTTHVEALGSDPMAVDREQCNQQDVAKLLPPFKPTLIMPNLFTKIFYDNKSYYSIWSLTSYRVTRSAWCVCLGGRGDWPPCTLGSYGSVMSYIAQDGH